DDHARPRRRSTLAPRNHAGEKRQEPEFLGQLFDSTVVRLVRTMGKSVGLRRGRGTMRPALILAFTIVVGLPGRPGAATSFPRPPEMEHQIRFWKKVFTEYSQDQVVIHDTADTGKTYSVLDFRPYVDQGYTSTEVEQIRRGTTDAEIVRVQAVLMRLQAGASRDSLAADERRIYDLFRNDSDPYKFQRAADGGRLRAQRGIREKFINGFRT